MDTNSLVEIKVPRAEKKVVKALDSKMVNQLILSIPNTFDRIRNKAIIIVLVDFEYANSVEYATNKQSLKCERCGVVCLVRGLHIDGSPMLALIDN